LDNQDYIPMTLNSANAASDILDRAWWIAASALIGQLSQQTVQLTTNRPLTTDIAERATWLENHFSTAEFEPDLTLPVTTPGGPDG
jgi:hypothetical protein